MSSAISPRPPAAELRPHLSHGPQPCFFSFYQLLPRITPLWWSGLSHAPPGRGWVGLGTRRHRMVTARSKVPAFPPSGCSKQLPRVCEGAPCGHRCRNNRHLLSHVLCRARGRPYSIPAPDQTYGVGPRTVSFSVEVTGSPDRQSRSPPRNTGRIGAQFSRIPKPLVHTAWN